MPRLAFCHFFGTPMVIANIGNAVDDLLTIELKHQPKRPCMDGWLSGLRT